MATTAAITGLGHPIQQLSSCLFSIDGGKIDLASEENRKSARIWLLEQMQSLQTKMVLLDTLELALKALAAGENCILVSLLDEDDYANLKPTAVEYEKRGLDPANLTGVARDVFEILFSCELKPRIEPWVDGEVPSKFALYTSW